MWIWNGLKISKQQHQILVTIYKYRCLNNEFLSRIIFRNSLSSLEVKKSNISRQVVTLRNSRLIESEVCIKNTKELFHFLTAKGIQYVKEHAHINRDHVYAGFDDVYGDFSAAQLKKIKSTMDHFKIFLDFSTSLSDFNSRHNLYCVRRFSEHQRVRPDGEIQSKNDPKKIIAIECDTGSERFSQLVDKFINYKNFFDFCIENKQSFPWEAIMFVQNKKCSSFESDVRWHTIIRAATEGLGKYCSIIPVIMHASYQPFNNLQYLITKEHTILEKVGVEQTSEVSNKNTAQKNDTDEKYKRLLSEREKNRKEIIKLELENEALRRWSTFPKEERFIKKGMFKKEENLQKREVYIKEYIDKNFEKRKLKRFPLLEFGD